MVLSLEWISGGVNLMTTHEFAARAYVLWIPREGVNKEGNEETERERERGSLLKDGPWVSWMTRCDCVARG